MLALVDKGDTWAGVDGYHFMKKKAGRRNTLISLIAHGLIARNNGGRFWLTDKGKNELEAS